MKQALDRVGKRWGRETQRWEVGQVAGNKELVTTKDPHTMEGPNLNTLL